MDGKTFLQGCKTIYEQTEGVQLQASLTSAISGTNLHWSLNWRDLKSCSTEQTATAPTAAGIKPHMPESPGQSAHIRLRKCP